MARNAGEFDRRIRLERRVTTKDPRFNAQVVTWVPDAHDIWARKLESSVAPGSNPGAAADVVAYGRPTKYWIRWVDAFDRAATRINDKGRILRVTGTAEVGRRDRLELACVEWAHEQ